MFAPIVACLDPFLGCSLFITRSRCIYSTSLRMAPTVDKLSGMGAAADKLSEMAPAADKLSEMVPAVDKLSEMAPAVDYPPKKLKLS